MGKAETLKRDPTRAELVIGHAMWGTPPEVRMSDPKPETTELARRLFEEQCTHEEFMDDYPLMRAEARAGRGSRKNRCKKCVEDVLRAGLAEVERERDEAGRVLREFQQEIERLK